MELVCYCLTAIYKDVYENLQCSNDELESWNKIWIVCFFPVYDIMMWSHIKLWFVFLLVRRGSHTVGSVIVRQGGYIFLCVPQKALGGSPLFKVLRTGLGGSCSWQWWWGLQFFRIVAPTRMFELWSLESVFPRCVSSMFA